MIIEANKRNEIIASNEGDCSQGNEIWQFPLLTHLNAKAIQSRIPEQNKSL